VTITPMTITLMIRMNVKAVDEGKEMARHNDANLIVHREDGQIKSNESYGEH
jgi:hypothetical protein